MRETRSSYDVISDPKTCVFCRLTSGAFWSSALALAVWDNFPVSPGHALILPRRHASAWDDLTTHEKADIFGAMDTVRWVIGDKAAYRKDTGT